MAEYIERDKAIDACFDGWNNNAHDCAENIRAIPAADVRPVVRGKWVYHGMVCGLEKCNCSLCGWHSFKRTNFCPNCGAYMGGE